MSIGWAFLNLFKNCYKSGFDQGSGPFLRLALKKTGQQSLKLYDMKIADLELTEQDFQLLVDGLDALPEKGMGGEIISSLFAGMLTKDDPEAKERLMREREIEHKKKEVEKQAQKEEIKILQGKLLMLKRWLQAEGALKQTYDIIGKL